MEGTETRIPLKLGRFLMTIARRRNIQRITVAAIIMDKGRIYRQDDSLPSREVGEEGIDAALDSLVKDLLEEDPKIRYLGYVDKEKKTRHYVFFLGTASGIKSIGGVPHLLDRREIEMITALARKKIRLFSLQD